MKINVISPINQLGYGITGLNIVKNLAINNDISLFMIGQPQVTNQNDADVISKCINNARFFDYNAPCIKIWHQHDMAQFAGRGTRIGFPIFELDTFNELEKHQLNSLDKIFVCSNWAKTIILNNINIDDKNVDVIPLGVDIDMFKPSEMPNNATTKFFNCGKWEIRKGHDVLVDWFNSAFIESDNVELYMMCENPFLSEEETKEWHKLYKNSKLGSKIHLIPRQNTQEEVYNIIKQMHCGIFPSRAEGWNLELLEMMSCGRPVITTDCSAHTEFCESSNAFLIDVFENTEKAYDGKWFHGHGNWATLNSHCKEQAIEYMREIHDKNQNVGLSLNSEGVITAEKYTWKNTTRRIIDAIQLF